MIVEIRLEVHLLDLQFVCRPLSEVAIIVGVVDVDHEVDSEVELQFLGDEVPLQHVLWNQCVPCAEELILVTFVK